MKKFIKTLLAVLLVMGLAGCASDTEETVEETTDETVEETTDTTEETTEEEVWVYDGPGYAALYADLGKADVDLSDADGKLAEILEKGQIIMATSPDYPPSEFVDAVTGEVMGSDIMLGQYIANSLGVELVVEPMDFGGVLTSLDTDKSDIAISGFGYKEDRAEVYELSNGYQSSSAAAHHTLLIKASDLDKINSLADFAGMTIDAQANSLQQMYVEDQLQDSTLQLVTSIDQEILDLSTGKVDAIAMDSTTAKNYAEQSDGQFVSVYVEKGIEFDLSMYEDKSGNVVAVKKGETSLINAINEIIDQMMAEGLYTDMYYAACDAAGVSPNEE